MIFCQHLLYRRGNNVSDSLNSEYILQIWLFFFFSLFRAAPAAYRSSQARGWITVTAASLHYSHSNSGSELHLQPTPQLMATPDPLTHWERPGIQPTSSWILVRFLTHWATWELHESDSCITLWISWFRAGANMETMNSRLWSCWNRVQWLLASDSWVMMFLGSMQCSWVLIHTAH